MRCRATFSVLLFVLACCFGSQALAGRYVVTYEHAPCKVEMVGPLGIYTTRPYTVENGVCKGFGTASDPIGSGTSTTIGGWAKCSGKITARVTWDNQGGENAKPPKNVVVVQTAKAEWNGSAGHCSNGLGDPEIDCVSQGTHYTLKTPRPLLHTCVQPGCPCRSWWRRFCIVCSDHQASQNYYWRHPRSEWRDQNAYRFALQYRGYDPLQTEITFDDHYWSIEGDIFKLFQVSYGHTTGTLIPFGPSDRFAAVPSWHWNDQNAAAEVSCSVGVFAGNDYIGAAQLSRDVDVVRPLRFDIYGEPGGYPTQVNYAPMYLPPGSKVIAGGPDFETQLGIEFFGNIETPEPFKSAWGAGEQMYGQLCYLDRYTYCQPADLPSAFHYAVNTGRYVLDNI